MTKTNIAKTAAQFVVGIGTGKIVGSIIRNNVTVESPADQAAVAATSAVIGWMAAEKTTAWTDAKIDEAVTWWNVNVKKNA
jgi:hypothetical protein